MTEQNFRRLKNKTNEVRIGTTFCMQLFNARNSFKHISRSTSGTFAATQPPYSLAYKEELYLSYGTMSAVCII